jgi:hypothetical protein
MFIAHARMGCDGKMHARFPELNLVVNFLEQINNVWNS